MKRGVRFSLTLFVLVLLVMLASPLYRFLVDTSVFAPRYDEGRFDAVRIGQDIQSVEAVLGPPLLKYYVVIVPGDGRIITQDEPFFISEFCNYRRHTAPDYSGIDTNSQVFVYSVSTHGDSYRIRQILVQTNKVARKIRKFYYD